MPFSTTCSCRKRIERRERIIERGELKEKGLSKNERIVSRKLIEQLFTGGQSHSLTAFPVRIVYQQTSNPHSQILISVPKRRFKHAVDRNRVKRQLREAYRKNKQLLSSQLAEGQAVALAFVWLSDHHLPTAQVEHRVVSLLKQICERINTGFGSKNT